MAKVRIGINGFGRIGRCFARSLASDTSGRVELGLINDLTDAHTLAHLHSYDSVHGRYPGTVEAGEDALVIDGTKIPITKEKDPASIPWSKHGVDVVVECTGLFVDRDGASKHFQAGAKKVIISAPAKQPDVTLACGINLESYQPGSQHIISNASCTTNCLAPVAKVMHDEFGIASGLMTTIHSYTNDQRLLDLPHKDLRRARAAALSMIPTTTGAAKALKDVIPSLEGKLDGLAIRVPTPNVSLVDLTAQLERPADKETINEAYRAAARGPLSGILRVADEPLVSTDFNGDLHSAVLDAGVTYTAGSVAKVLAWYDNEMGYAQRLFDLTAFVASKL